MKLHQKYSVLMSVYEKEKPDFLRQSMQSVYEQTIPTDDFVLICDGPLTRELDDVINEMKNKFEERLRVIRRNKKHGLGRSLNLGVKKCKNEFIMRMDSDDVSTKDRAEKQLALFDDGFDVVGSNIVEYDKNLKEVFGKRIVPEKDEDIRKYAKRRNPINHMSVCFKKSKVIKAGNYIDMMGFEDYYLWVRMIRCNCRFLNIQKSLVKVRGGDAMLKRRGGGIYLKRMLRFEKVLRKMDYISRKEYYENIIIRAFSSMAPLWIRSGLYRKVLRGGVK